jgi:hypothetical protein
LLQAIRGNAIASAADRGNVGIINRLYPTGGKRVKESGLLFGDDTGIHVISGGIFEG